MTQRFLISAMMLALCAAPALAQCEKTCEKSATCQMKDQGKACSMDDKAKHEKAEGAMCASEVTCDGDRVHFKGVDIPRIGFKVGDKITCCMKSVKEMVKGDMSKVTFVIADKTYKDLGKAQAARLKVLEEYYEGLLTVKYAVGDDCVTCPVSAKDMAKATGKPVRFRLAAFDFEKKEAAMKAAKLARASADKVAMSWSVGDKKFNCPVEAGDVAKSSGKNVEFCVGEQKTTCETTAKTRLVEARITPAIETSAPAAQG